MLQFSSNTFKHAKLVYQLKQQLRDHVPDDAFDDIDLISFANEITQSFQETPSKDSFRDPGIKRDYRNYDLDHAFEFHQNEIFSNENYAFDDLYSHTPSIENFLANSTTGWMI